MTAPTIPLYSGTVPNRNQSANDFADNADNWLSYQSPLAADYNGLATYLDAIALQVNDNASNAAISELAAETSASKSESSNLQSQANASFKGRWSDATGAATVPSSYSNNGQTWQLLQDIADITADEPVSGAVNWQVINDINLSNIRFDLVNNPDFHLFAKNKIVKKAAVGTVLSVSRPSAGTFFDFYGVPKTYINDTPREERKGFLFEPDSSNLTIKSKAYENIAWTKSGTLTVVDNAALGSDGTLTASTITTTDMSDANLLIQTTTLPIVGQYLGFSHEVKGGSATEFNIVTVTLSGGTVTEDVSVFDSSVGVFTSISPNHIVDVEPLSNGWFKVSALLETNTTGNSQFQTRIGLKRIGVGYISKTQSEEGGVTSFIETDATQETRLADSVDLGAYNNAPDVGRPFSVSGVIDGLTLPLLSVLEYYWQIPVNETSSPSEGCFLLKNSDGGLLFRISDGTNGANVFFSPITERANVICSYDGGSIYVYVNGELVGQADASLVSVTTKTDSKIYIARRAADLTQSPRVHYRDFKGFSLPINIDEAKYLRDTDA